MRLLTPLVTGSVSVILLVTVGAFNKESKSPHNSGFRQNITFNHLSLVVDDSTYRYLFDSLSILKNFAETSEQTIDAGSDGWTGKYCFGMSNYLEIFRPGGANGTKAGDLGIGFMTDKLGTVDSLQRYWEKTLDSVHVEKMVITDSDKTTPWYTSVSIPNVDSLKVSGWVMENAKEEMIYAGFTEKDLSGEIAFSEYKKHISAKLHNVPVDSVKYDKLFDRVTSLDLNLSGKELSYLRHFLLDIGFREERHSFLKEDFSISYFVTESPHFLLKGIGFSLAKKMPKQMQSYRKIALMIDRDKAEMRFN
jgi:hypothetical protein